MSHEQEVDLRAFEEAMRAAVASATSLEAIAAWLAQQPNVRDVQVSDALMKSNPPQRAVTFELAREAAAGGPVRRVAHVWELGGAYRLRDIADA